MANRFQDLPLFSPELARQGKDSGMSLAAASANPEFMDAAIQAIHDAAKERPYVSANDIWQALEPAGITTHENRATGPVMTHCARKGWIVKTDRTQKSTRSSRHLGDVRVWQSLLFKP